MKSNLLKVISVLLCLVAVISVFASCGDKNGNDGNASDGEGIWSQTQNVEEVELTTSEMAVLVKEALGKLPQGFDGTFASLSAEDQEVVAAAAEAKGYIVEAAEDGRTVIKKQAALVDADDDEVVELVEDALGSKFKGDINTLTDEQMKKVSAEADKKGYYIVDDENGKKTVKKKDVASNATKGQQEQVSKIVSEVLGDDAKNFDGNTDNLDPEKQKELESRLNEEAGVNGREAGEIIQADITTTVYNPDNYTAPTENKSIKPKTSATTTKTYTAQSTTKRVNISEFNKAWISNFSNNNAIFSDCGVTKDGGVVAVGNYLNASNTSSFIVKYKENDKEAKVDWKVDIKPNSMINMSCLLVLDDDSVIVFGYTFCQDMKDFGIDKMHTENSLGTSDAIMIKYNKNGKMQWAKVLGGTKSDAITSAALTPDGGILIGGRTASTDDDFAGIGAPTDGYDQVTAFAIKYADTDMKTKSWGWYKRSMKHCEVDGLGVSPDGSVYAAVDVNIANRDFATYPNANTGSEKTLIVKLSGKDGKEEWGHFLCSSSRTVMTKIIPTSDGGLLCAGYYSSREPVVGNDGRAGTFASEFNGGNAGTADAAVVKLTANGQESWLKTFVGFENDFIYDIAETNNCYVVIGQSSSTNRDFSFMPGYGDNDIFMFIIRPDGTVANKAAVGGSSAESVRAICADGSGTLYFCGSTSSKDGDFQGMTPAASSSSYAAYICRMNIDEN